MDGGAVFGCVNLIGIIASSLGYLRRAGFADLKAREGVDWREFLLPNISYFLLTFVKILAWPVVLVGWLAQGLPPSRWRAVTELDGRPVRQVVRLAAADREHLLDRTGDLSSRAGAGALAAVARRVLTGGNPWGTGENEVIGGLAIRLDGATRQEAGTATLFDELEMASVHSGWVALGIWFMVSECGPAQWRHDPRAQEWFVTGIAAASRDPGADQFTYRCDAVEEDLVRRTEPAGGPRWRFVRPRPSDLVERAVPPHGGEPAVAELADGEQYHLATLAGDDLYASRRPDGTYVTVRARRCDAGRGAVDEEFATARTLVELLRATGERIGGSMPDWIHRDLDPYVPTELPAWWPR